MAYLEACLCAHLLDEVPFWICSLYRRRLEMSRSRMCSSDVGSTVCILVTISLYRV